MYLKRGLILLLVQILIVLSAMFDNMNDPDYSPISILFIINVIYVIYAIFYQLVLRPTDYSTTLVNDDFVILILPNEYGTEFLYI